LQSYEVIGSPPNVSVPTHFAKVVLTTKPSSPSKPDVLELATGAFVLPNAVIPDDAPLTSFVVPGTSLLPTTAPHCHLSNEIWCYASFLPILLIDLFLCSLLTYYPFFFFAHMPSTVEAVERAAGLTFFSDTVKANSKHICKSTDCSVIVRRFDDAQKRPEVRRAISAPR
jgi:endonuclease G, mitochondrial